jgi:hypothetical protein
MHCSTWFVEMTAEHSLVNLVVIGDVPKLLCYHLMTGIIGMAAS